MIVGVVTPLFGYCMWDESVWYGFTRLLETKILNTVNSQIPVDTPLMNINKLFAIFFAYLPYGQVVSKVKFEPWDT